MSLKVMEIFHVKFDRNLINTEVGILAGYICVTWLAGDISMNDIFPLKISVFWYFSFQLCSLDVLWLRLGENQGGHLTSGSGPLFCPVDIWGQLFVGNIFLTRYLAERNTFLWNCIIWRKENPTDWLVGLLTMHFVCLRFGLFFFFKLWKAFNTFCLKKRNNKGWNLVLYTAKMLWALYCFFATNFLQNCAPRCGCKLGVSCKT